MRIPWGVPPRNTPDSLGLSRRREGKSAEFHPAGRDRRLFGRFQEELNAEPKGNLMRLRYDPVHDVIRDGEGAIDYAEEMGAFLVHCTAEGRPVLLELFEAGEFLRHARRLVEGGGDDPRRGGPEAHDPGGG